MTTTDVVLALLRRLSPPWPSTDPDTRVGKELRSIAATFAPAKDLVDALVDELFPDTTTYLIDRWERLTGVGSIPSDPLPVRRARVVARLRKLNGPRISQLETMLAPILDMSIDDMVWVEQLRSNIEEALTITTGTVTLAVPTTAPGLTLSLGRPWPGVVDDGGVSVYIAMSGVGTTTATLTGPDGTVWTIPVTGAVGWYRTRTLFTGKVAGGLWLLNIRDSSAPTLTEARLLVSNSIDSGAIYNLFLLRDPTVAGSPDIVEAQRLFRSTASAHNRAFVIERLAFTLGDAHSIFGRDPIGA